MKSKNLFYILQLLEKQQRYLTAQELKQHNDYNASELLLARQTTSEVSLEYAKSIQEEFKFTTEN